MASGAYVTSDVSVHGKGAAQDRAQGRVQAQGLGARLRGRVDVQDLMTGPGDRVQRHSLGAGLHCGACLHYCGECPS